MEIDADLLARFGIDQETFDRLRKTSPNARAYTLEEYRRLDQDELWTDQCRDQLKRPPDRWIQNGFCHVHRPVLDDEPFRAFATLEEYRQWCAECLPKYLGLERVEVWPPAQEDLGQAAHAAR